MVVGGWNCETGEIFKETNAQIDQAFENCEVALKSAGGKGWSQVSLLAGRSKISHLDEASRSLHPQVYRVNSCHLPLKDEALAAMTRNLRKYMPDHQPLWTCVGVTRLGEDDMRVEIEVWAHVQE